MRFGECGFCDRKDVHLPNRYVLDLHMTDARASIFDADARWCAGSLGLPEKIRPSLRERIAYVNPTWWALVGGVTLGLSAVRLLDLINGR